ncbi:MAG: hypothetical protein A2748_02580 [Candidatus Wildermuthbacteria bacterium RIFCSPHIGHO2_01_FULL_45_20]|uniref:YgjP-like metallopeptidase domain-containing protein n=1 Tax=Candidatus Wildermuthbacteria bacterium RIFCSPHIGHO2_02_FULL_45_25 TaxID=1802450 RepID=A0A1G2QXD8_9BACT|nr:MAG: hypothetical protein A2748_02580 [Candidatus Wildermuthbacteria bacterium RIFCSPHIGHO2_01_FULL_45_20]OHA65250.1 MAG: hypothetical protein A3C04_03005 [Candidatus Wildermuthbacteria bacterium RIFCSPHIGHO2_02_FULL_45_25]
MRKITYDIIYTRRKKTLALVVEHDGSLTVRAPKKTSRQEIQRFVEQKRLWIQEKTRQHRLRKMLAPKLKFQPGEKFLYFGVRYKLQFTKKNSPDLVFRRQFVLAKENRGEAKRLFIDWYKQQAEKELFQRSSAYARKMGVEFKSLHITSAKHQLGSCTRRKTINFPWRLMMAPSFVVNYIVVHELAHLAFMNHSKNFWRKVGETYPTYKEAEQWLKSHGHLLNFE